MLYKFALCEVVKLDTAQSQENESGMVKTASGRVIIEPGSDKAKIVASEVKKHPTALFFRAKAIKANEANSNGDYFSVEELLRSYKSFEGVPFFTNHDNQNIENARGKIIYAEWMPAEKAVYTIGFVDREAFPHICRSIEEEYVTGVSMGCSVEYSTCSICGNRAEKTEDYCNHIKNRKGRKFSGRAKNVLTGEVKDFQNAPVFEYNYGIKFIELSAVVDPACPSCHIQGIIPNDEFVRKVANIQNGIYMVKTAAIEKQAGQEEIASLNQVLKTLEDIAVGLIKNRQQIEVEFASDLVEILSKLQTFVDELVGAGFGNMAGVPGTAQPQGEAPEAVTNPIPSQAGEAASMAAPVAEEVPAGGGVGAVSGSPAKPLVQSPKLPITAPIRPKAFDKNGLIRLADSLESLREKLFTIGEDDMGKRRVHIMLILSQKNKKTLVDHLINKCLKILAT